MGGDVGAKRVQLRFSCVLNMSPTMAMPGDHCDMPPKSAWLN
jgi:hypothetical protein